ncbi:hypothetical protein B9G53_14270 [Pseudanabaena sp. SR411]|uniref:DUF4082 domain-containing protein n=1 Tax=Pseudanabaena sp. SR411 TaxID=1980935 RepID=UPI000B99C27F|nr:DUF4082 domain-containing protein [Pseudanabaena sp. SR411]OYQ63966.1 hypothetical protein B9G53_14270 [Pseudanabaena sp. SR411]
MIDLANPANWLTIYEAQTVHVGGAPLPPILVDGSFDHRYLRVTSGNEYPKPSWQLGAYIDLMLDESTPETRAYRFESPINEAALLVVPDWLEIYKIRAIAPKWFRCIELKIDGYLEFLGITFFGDEPDNFVSGEPPYELGFRFASSVEGQITAIRYFKPSTETGTHTGHIWSSGGTLLRTQAFTSETSSGWQEQLLDSPLNISVDTFYTVSVNSNESYSAQPNYFTDVLLSDVLYTGSAISTGVFNTSVGSFPTDSFNSNNYFRDIRFIPSNS